jgi:hypothetical protein
VAASRCGHARRGHVAVEGNPATVLAHMTNKDFWSGVMLVVIGLATGYIALDYPFGTVLRMGSGFFPLVLAGLLVLFGVMLLVRSAASTEQIEPGWSLRGLVIIPLALVAFGLLLERAGFVPAMFAVVIGSALAGTEFRIIEVLAVCCALTFLGVAIFVWGLGMPFTLIAGM